MVELFFGGLMVAGVVSLMLQGKNSGDWIAHEETLSDSVEDRIQEVKDKFLLQQL